MSQPSESLRKTPLHDRHLAAGGRMVPFAGWEMPVQYTGVMEEHRAVRGAAGLFDVSHMGEIRIRGEGAVAFLQGLVPNDVAKLGVGRAHYNALLTDAGTYVDDLLVYKLAPDDLLVVVNAANAEKDFAVLAGHPHPGCTLTDESDDWALLAVQGPRAPEIVAGLTPADLGAIRYYGFAQSTVAGRPAIVSRTGYTGEDGFELYCAPADAPALWDALLEAGSGVGLVPAGLGARDTLRLEAGMALYGHEIDATVTPWEAGLDWTIKLEKGDFVGRAALVEQKQKGPARKLVGLEVTGKGIAREGYAVRHEGREVGRVVSGTFGPTLGKAIATALLPVALTALGTEVVIDVRGRETAARVVPLPFYKRPAG